MKISIISGSTEYTFAGELQKAAISMGIDCNIFVMQRLVVTPQISSVLGDVIFWRNWGEKNIKEISSLHEMLRNRIHINYADRFSPISRSKLFQQSLVSTHYPLQGITTHHLKKKSDLELSIKEGRLHFPFVQKPDVGACGRGISLVQDLSEVVDDENISQYIYQDYIPNTFDYRVFVIGGRVIGAIKRTGKKGSFLNNVSQGGVASAETNISVLRQLEKVALSVASLFGFGVCGVDILYDSKSHCYRFLEVNSSPGWHGFVQATGIDIPREIIKYAHLLHERNTLPIESTVESYLNESTEYLSESKRFHYISCMALWTGTDVYKEKLLEERVAFLGTTDDDIRERISSRLRSLPVGSSTVERIVARIPYNQKYPTLKPVLRVLFFELFAETCFGKDIAALVDEQVSRDDLHLLRKQLQQDPSAVAVLSTHAVNFFYLAEYYAHKRGLENDFSVDPQFFMHVAEKEYAKMDALTLSLHIYLVTHAIIGESHFYARRVTRNVETYIKMLQSVEGLLEKYYYEISLDCKFEFLVSCRLCQYSSRFAEMIFQEAQRSLSPVGNYLVDTLNDRKKAGNDFLDMREQATVLYLLATKKFHKQT